MGRTLLSVRNMWPGKAAGSTCSSVKQIKLHWERPVRKQGFCFLKKRKNWSIDICFLFVLLISTKWRRKKTIYQTLRNLYPSVVLHQGHYCTDLLHRTSLRLRLEPIQVTCLQVCLQQQLYGAPHNIPRGQVQVPSLHHLFWNVLGPSTPCSFSSPILLRTAGDIHRGLRKENGYSLVQNDPAPFKHRCFYLLLWGHLACLNSLIMVWIQDTCSREGNYGSAIPSSTARTFALQEYVLVSLVPEPKSSSSHLFPGDTGHTELYTYSAANCWAVSPCTVNQLPSFTGWRHWLFRVSFVLRPTDDCTYKKPDELIMQTRQQRAPEQLEDQSPIRLTV